MKLAIIDLGTNSLRLDIHKVGASGEPKLIHREKRMVRLGDGVYDSGLFSSGIIKRGRQAFRDILDTITENNVDETVAFATSAMRSAANAQDLVHLIKDDTGIEVQIISGQRECELIAKGILANEELPTKAFLMVDIGGGSTEINFCRGGQRVAGESFALGANRLQQVFLKAIPPKGPEAIEELRAAVRALVAPKFEAWAEGEPIKSVMGSSGTIRALSRIIKKAGEEVRPFRRKSLETLIDDMKVMKKSELIDIPGLEPRRVDLILAGAVLLDEILSVAGAKKVFTTSFSLRDGILQEQLMRLDQVL